MKEMVKFTSVAILRSICSLQQRDTLPVALVLQQQAMTAIKLTIESIPSPAGGVYWVIGRSVPKMQFTPMLLPSMRSGTPLKEKFESFWPKKLSHSKWFAISSQFDSNILQLLGIPGLILVPPVTQLFRSKWLHFFFQWTCVEATSEITFCYIRHIKLWYNWVGFEYFLSRVKGFDFISRERKKDGQFS